MSKKKKTEPIMERRVKLTPKAEEIIEKHLSWAFLPKKDQRCSDSTPKEESEK